MSKNFRVTLNERLKDENFKSLNTNLSMQFLIVEKK